MRKRITNRQELVRKWFDTWEAGDFLKLPISDHFKHTSPFGTIDSKEQYLNLVKANKDRFLGYRFHIHDEIFEGDRGCVRYTAIQGDFKLDVSEWYFIKNDLIESIIAYYHIGEIRPERQLANPEDGE